ncbi:hypothetical protein NDU88_008165 [Pleurodeles waltl]|uniref:Uncharacterized protein n=1 Tax=Pleurodeles waltl TaxID=8319 RepID=A0AAV7VUP1_PLEWA|nr:hypothetical protein NDU88_008165 [Pleurodeles waltl]
MALAGASTPALPGVRGKKTRTPGSAGVGENGVRARERLPCISLTQGRRSRKKMTLIPHTLALDASNAKV